MDQRDELIDELAKMVNINVVYDQNGSANISIGGIQAVDATGYVEFEAKVINNSLTMALKDNGTKVKLSGGELYGLSQIYSDKIPDYLNSLNELATAVMDSVNAVHATGYSLETSPETGINFFDSYSEGELVINPAILIDAAKIAASSDGTEGDGQIAADIANIANSSVLNNLTLNENYSRMISKLGNEKQNVDQIAESTNLVIEQLEVQKGSISGVSLDEEMTNIIRFQRSYDASAKLISIADEMLETLINMV